MGSQMRMGMGIVIVCVYVYVCLCVCVWVALSWQLLGAHVERKWNQILWYKRASDRTGERILKPGGIALRSTAIFSDLQRSAAIYSDLQHSYEALCNDLAINEACIYTHKYYIYWSWYLVLAWLKPSAVDLATTREDIDLIFGDWQINMRPLILTCIATTTATGKAAAASVAKRKWRSHKK